MNNVIINLYFKHLVLIMRRKRESISNKTRQYSSDLDEWSNTSLLNATVIVVYYVFEALFISFVRTLFYDLRGPTCTSIRARSSKPRLYGVSYPVSTWLLKLNLRFS